MCIVMFAILLERDLWDGDLTGFDGVPQSISERQCANRKMRQQCEGVSIMGLFAKAASKVKTGDAPKKKGVAWLVGDPAGDAVAKSVKELVRLDAESKAIEANMGIHKTIVKKHAEELYVSTWADEGVGPDTPMYIQTSDGERVTYVVQDRSGQYGVKDEQKDALAQLLGPDAVEGLLFDETRFSFNREVMAIPGVQEAVEKALEEAVKKLTGGKKPVLTEEQAESLVDVEQKTAFKPGTLDRLSVIAGRDTNRIRQFLECMASSCTRYVKC